MMKKFKHILSLVLTILLLFTACGTVPPDPTNTEQTKATEEKVNIPPNATRPETTEPDPAAVEMKINCQHLPETVENPDNLPVLKWVCLLEAFSGGAYGRVWNEAAAIELNQMLADRNMPFRIQFVIYTSDYYYSNMDWFVRPEVQAAIAEADLLTGSISADRVKDYFMSLTEYAVGKAEPSLKNTVPHEMNWLQTTVGNEVYGISQVLLSPENGGWLVDPAILTEYGLTEQDFQKDFWEMDDVLAKIYEKNGNKAFFYISSSLKHISTKSSLGIKSRYPGVVSDIMKEYFTEVGSVFAIDHSQNAPKVINMLDTDIARKLRDAAKRYKEAGYAVQDYGDAKVYFHMVTGHRPYTNIEGSYRFIPVFSPTYDNSQRAFLLCCNGVSATTTHKNEALSLLSLIGEDEAFRMQLMFGKEGRDYTIDAKGNYQITKQEDGSNYSLSFLSPWSNLSGMTGGSTLSPGTWGTVVQYEGKTALESYLEMWENVGEPYYTIRFDYTGLEEELEAVKNVCDLYFYRFATLSDEKYAEMIKKINAAGGTKIMAELQKQLDEWVKENPEKAAANRRFG